MDCRTKANVMCSQRRSNTPPDSPRAHRRWLGTFNTAEEAAVVYDLRKRQIKGEHTKCNFAALDDSGELGTVLNGSVCGFKRDHLYWEPQTVEGERETWCPWNRFIAGLQIVHAQSFELQRA